MKEMTKKYNNIFIIWDVYKNNNDKTLYKININSERAYKSLDQIIGSTITGLNQTIITNTTAGLPACT